MKFKEKLRQSISETDSCLCVGLDPYLDSIPHIFNRQKSPVKKVSAFLKTVIDLTNPYCAAYKPNLAFFEALGTEGYELLSEIIDYIPKKKIIIADAKRGDISSSSEHYCKSYFERFDVDAITLNPLMGFETLEPFTTYPEKGIFVLTLTSNPGASDFLLKPFSGFDSMAEFISSSLKELQLNSETVIGMVVGATQTRNLETVLKQNRNAPLLIPGIGKQGGTFSTIIDLLSDHKGIPLISSSRSILYPVEPDNKNWEQELTSKVKNYRKQLLPLSKQYV